MSNHRVADTADSVHTRQDLVEFLRRLSAQAQAAPRDWQNRDLPSYLEALAAWTQDMEGYFHNRGEPVPEPSWALFAEMLLAARVYE